MENEKKKNIRKKLCVGTVGVIVLLFAVSVIFRYTPFLKEEMANSKFGMELCPYFPERCLIPWGGECLGVSLTAVSSFKCDLCGKFSKYSSSPTPIICDFCAEITNRCEWCGRILEK